MGLKSFPDKVKTMSRKHLRGKHAFWAIRKRRMKGQIYLVSTMYFNKKHSIMAKPANKQHSLLYK